MKIKNLLMSAAFLIISGGAMAQTTITAGDVKKVSSEEARLSYYYKNTEAMGGFQLVVSLPKGVTLEENAAKTDKGLSINGGAAVDATFYNVTVPSGFECIGVTADVDGTTSDGTPYKPGDILLACFPVKTGVSFKATEKASKLCTLLLTASEGISEEVLKAVTITGFVGSDTNGTGAETTAQYMPSADSNMLPVSVLKAGDVNKDTLIGIGDIISVTNYMTNGEGSDVTLDLADVNTDGEVGIGDIISITNIMTGN